MIDKAKTFFRYIFSARFATHLLMLAFAGASLGNIKDFFMTLHAGDQVSWGVGVALGGALVIMEAVVYQPTGQRLPQPITRLLEVKR